jgi:glycosyltransferase involved in cell wall biosynthesis
MNSKSTKNISALIITLNEEIHMNELLNNLNFVNEIIIVDSYSNDKTQEISESFSKVNFIQHPFENFTAQRNFAILQAKNDWLLFLDADERISEKLKKEILETVKNPEAKDAYYFFRKFMFMKKPLLFSGWQTDKNIRLFKKGTAHYISTKLVHEKLEVNGSIGKLKNKLIHYSFTDYESYKQKMVHYGKLKAKELFLKEVQPNGFHFIIKPTYKFLYNYLFRLGILDGKKGVIICFLNALSVYVRFQELKKLRLKS